MLEYKCRGVRFGRERRTRQCVNDIQREDIMFEFLKSAQPLIDDNDETGTYADAFLQVPDVQQLDTAAREYGHEAHTRDYGQRRQVSRSAMGFA